MEVGFVQGPYPDTPADAPARAFKPSFGFSQQEIKRVQAIIRANRRQLSMRRKSNANSKRVEECLPQIQRWNRRYRRLLQEPKRHEGQMVPVSGLQRGAPGTYTREDDQIQLVQPFLGLEKRHCTVQPNIRPGGKTTRKRHIFFADQACEGLRWKERHTINAWMSISNGIIGLTANSVSTGRRFRSVGARWERVETCRESGWLFSPAPRTGRGQTIFFFGNIHRARATPFIGLACRLNQRGSAHRPWLKPQDEGYCRPAARHVA